MSKRSLDIQTIRGRVFVEKSGAQGLFIQVGGAGQTAGRAVLNSEQRRELASFILDGIEDQS